MSQGPHRMNGDVLHLLLAAYCGALSRFNLPPQRRHSCRKLNLVILLDAA